jgi:hypothetical protein
MSLSMQSVKSNMRIAKHIRHQVLFLMVNSFALELLLIYRNLVRRLLLTNRVYDQCNNNFREFFFKHKEVVKISQVRWQRKLMWKYWHQILFMDKVYDLWDEKVHKLFSKSLEIFMGFRLAFLKKKRVRWCLKQRYGGVTIIGSCIRWLHIYNKITK